MNKLNTFRNMDPCIPIPLDEKTLEDIVEKAKDYCLMHGKCKIDHSFLLSQLLLLKFALNAIRALCDVK